MTAYLNQDFVTYQGDDPQPVFTVLDSSGTAVDISTVSDITWIAKLNASTAAVVSKTKLTGGIAFTNTGTDGKFTVSLTKVDTAALTGNYEHYASITDAIGAITTVTVGRLQVGLEPVWTFDASSVSSQDLYGVRALYGDTIYAEQQLPDS